MQRRGLDHGANPGVVSILTQLGGRMQREAGIAQGRILLRFNPHPARRPDATPVADFVPAHREPPLADAFNPNFRAVFSRCLAASYTGSELHSC